MRAPRVHIKLFLLCLYCYSVIHTNTEYKLVKLQIQLKVAGFFTKISKTSIIRIIYIVLWPGVWGRRKIGPTSGNVREQWVFTFFILIYLFLMICIFNFKRQFLYVQLSIFQQRIEIECFVAQKLVAIQKCLIECPQISPNYVEQQ